MKPVRDAFIKGAAVGLAAFALTGCFNHVTGHLVCKRGESTIFDANVAEATKANDANIMTGKLPDGTAFQVTNFTSCVMQPIH
jgi:hypothetical protein